MYRFRNICVMAMITGVTAGQDYHSYGSSNFGGVMQVLANPAHAADNRLRLDVLPGGYYLNFNNSWFGIKRSALSYSGSILKPAHMKFPDSWNNFVPGVPDNFFKNFNWHSGQTTRSIVFEERVMLPSVLWSIDAKQAVAFTWSIRQICNLDGLGTALAGLFEKEFDLNVTQNNRVTNSRVTAVQATWAEYGITWARVLYQKRKHFVKAGITPKLLHGYRGGYMALDNLDFLFSTRDSLSYFNTSADVARSQGLSSPFSVQGALTGLYKPGAVQGGFDAGVVYEWRPQFAKYIYRPDGKQQAFRRDLNKYRLRAGISLTDIGRLRFRKERDYYSLNISLRESDIYRYAAVTSYRMLDSLLRKDFPRNTGPETFDVMLPACINLLADYAIHRNLFVNLSSRFAGLYGEKLNVHRSTAFCLAPRYETYWVDFAVPVSYDAVSASRGEPVAVGINLRAGPLWLGTGNFSALFREDIGSLSFYAIVKISIPNKRITDRDGDGIPDTADECPDEPGEPTARGCPDKDKDTVPDKEDACPNQPGRPERKGCP